MGSTFSVMNDTNDDCWCTYLDAGSEVSEEVGFTSFCSTYLFPDSGPPSWNGYPVTGNMTNNEFGDQVINMTVSGFASQSDAQNFYQANISGHVESILYDQPPGANHQSGSMTLSFPQHYWGIKATVGASSILLERGYLAVTSGAKANSNNSYNMSSMNWSYSSR